MGEDGIALITTLLITAVLVTVIVEFIFSVFIQTSRVEDFRDSARAGVLADNGVIVGAGLLGEVLSRKPYLTIGTGGLKFSQREGDGLVLDITVYDELARVSTRVVYANTGLANDRIDSVYARLLKTLGLDERLRDTLADWIDEDNEPRNYGAETAGYYSRLPKPYEAGNLYLRSADELRLVKGYTPEVFNELSRFVTVYNPEGLVNINTAPVEVIMALADGVSRELAAKVIEYRARIPFADRSGIMKVPGFETIGFAMQDKITVQSRVFRIYSRATANKAVRVVEAVVRVNGGAGAGVLYWRED